MKTLKLLIQYYKKQHKSSQKKLLWRQEVYYKYKKDMDNN